jgi:hypothetical protein
MPQPAEASGAADSSLTGWVMTSILSNQDADD